MRDTNTTARLSASGGVDELVAVIQGLEERIRALEAPQRSRGIGTNWRIEVNGSQQLQAVYYPSGTTTVIANP